MYHLADVFAMHQLPYLSHPGQTGQKLLVNVAAVLAAIQLARSVVPASWQHRVHKYLGSLWAEQHCQLTFPQYSGSALDENYARIGLYLSSLEAKPAHRCPCLAITLHTLAGSAVVFMYTV